MKNQLMQSVTLNAVKGLSPQMKMLRLRFAPLCMTVLRLIHKSIIRIYL